MIYFEFDEHNVLTTMESSKALIKGSHNKVKIQVRFHIDSVSQGNYLDHQCRMIAQRPDGEKSAEIVLTPYEDGIGVRWEALFDEWLTEVVGVVYFTIILKSGNPLDYDVDAFGLGHVVVQEGV